MTSQSQNTGTSREAADRDTGSDKRAATRDSSLVASPTGEEVNRPQGADWQQGTRDAENKAADRQTPAGSEANRSGDTSSR